MPHWTLIANKHETTRIDALEQQVLALQHQFLTLADDVLEQQVLAMQHQLFTLTDIIKDLQAEKEPQSQPEPDAVTYVNPVSGNTVRWGTRS